MVRGGTSCPSRKNNTLESQQCVGGRWHDSDSLAQRCLTLHPTNPLSHFLAYVVELWTENELCRRVSAERTHLLMKEVFDTFNCSIANQTVTVMSLHYRESSKREAHSLLWFMQYCFRDEIFFFCSSSSVCFEKEKQYTVKQRNVPDRFSSFLTVI